MLRIIRPHIVAGGLLGYSLGGLLALNWGAAFDPSMFALGYLVVLFMDLATHFSNDYFDVELDANSPGKPFGGSYLLVDHQELRLLAITISVVLSIVSFTIALAMVLILGSPPTFLILAGLTNLLGWLYSAPPVRLNSRGLGEITIAIGTGFSIPAIGYMALAGAMPNQLIFFLLPMIVYGFILALTLEIPDLEVDRDSDRVNIVVLMGRRAVAILILLLSVSALLVFSLFAALNSTIFWAVPVLSVAPVYAGLNGFLKLNSPAKANRVSRINISALFLFLVILDIYLLMALLS